MRRTDLAHGSTAPRPRTPPITNHSHIPTNLYSYLQARPQARLGIHRFPLLISPSQPKPYYTFECLKPIYQLERRQLSCLRCEFKTRQLLAALLLRRFHFLHLVHLPQLLSSHPRHFSSTARTHHACHGRRPVYFVHLRSRHLAQQDKMVVAPREGLDERLGVGVYASHRSITLGQRARAPPSGA